MLVLLLTGCSGDNAASDAATPASDAAPLPSPSGDGQYAFGTDRDQIATAVEASMASKGAKAHWEGDTLVLVLPDGDANDGLAGFTECRAMGHLLADGDASAIEFPNGRVSCADVLSED